MFDQLDSFIIRYDELSELLSDPEVIGDTKRFMELTKEEANLRPKVETFKRYQQVVEEISDTEEMLGESLDAEMAEMAKEELSALKKEKVELEDKIKFLLLPEDPNDGKNIIMEIRGAAGGDEAALFAGDLLNMYQKYAEAQGWRVEVMDANVTGIGGYKEVILMITGALITPSSDGCKVNKFAPFSSTSTTFSITSRSRTVPFSTTISPVSGSTKFSAIVWCNKRVLRFNFLLTL